MNKVLEEAIDIRDSKVVKVAINECKYYLLNRIDGTRFNNPFPESEYHCTSDLGIILAYMSYYKIADDGCLPDISVYGSFIVTENLIMPIRTFATSSYERSNTHYLASVLNEFKTSVTYFIASGELFHLYARCYEVMDGHIYGGLRNTSRHLTLLEAYEEVTSGSMKTSNSFSKK